MNKIKLLALLVIPTVIIVGCNNPNNSSSSESSSIISSESSSSMNAFVPKPVDGIAPIFDEGMGFYNIQPSVIDEESCSYIFYTVNKTEGVVGNDVIAVRKVTTEGTNTIYGEKKIVLETSTSGWDSKHISNADVIKGAFTYNTAEYTYLMAYQANDIEAEKNYSIGLAVSNNPETAWVKVGTMPLIKYDTTVYGDTWGIGQPSLLSYDGEGKVYIFFTMGEQYSTQTYVRELDLSNLNDIKGNIGFNAVSTKGLIDGNGYTMLNDTDFVLDKNSNKLYVVRNYNPESALSPKLTTAVQVARLDLADLYVVNSTWEIVEERINMLDLETPTTGGWERVYSGSIVADAYGYLSNVETLKVTLSVTSYDIVTKDYIFYQTITVVDINNI